MCSLFFSEWLGYIVDNAYDQYKKREHKSTKYEPLAWYLYVIAFMHRLIAKKF